MRGGHVVRHDIEQQAQVERARGLDECSPCRIASEIIADLGRIRDVVAVLTAGNGLQTRRQIDMTDAELRKVGQDFLCRGQRESRMQLQAVGRDPFSAHD
jgi:hypothetical protein